MGFIISVVHDFVILKTVVDGTEEKAHGGAENEVDLEAARNHNV